MTAAAATPGAFETFVQYAGVILQLLYYFILPVCAIVAAWQFKRFVDLKAGKVAAKSEKTADAGESVAVEDFVE